jgi:hypothetical protein
MTRKKALNFPENPSRPPFRKGRSQHFPFVKRGAGGSYTTKHLINIAWSCKLAVVPAKAGNQALAELRP